MISVMNYSGDTVELKLLEKEIHELAARYSDEKWDVNSFGFLAEMDKFIKDNPVLNLSCYDVSEKGSLDYLHVIRKIYRELHLMLIADSNMSPMDYVKPDILASELILRPYKEADIKNKLYSFISSYLHLEREEEFILDTKGEKLRVPYCQIYYFEACDKKIYVRLKREGKGFYGTLDALELTLPEYFVRCHRSYLVNAHMIEKVSTSQKLLDLADNIQIPFSRSYKNEIYNIFNR